MTSHGHFFEIRTWTGLKCSPDQGINLLEGGIEEVEKLKRAIDLDNFDEEEEEFNFMDYYTEEQIKEMNEIRDRYTKEALERIED